MIEVAISHVDSPAPGEGHYQAVASGGLPVIASARIAAHSDESEFAALFSLATLLEYLFGLDPFELEVTFSDGSTIKATTAQIIDEETKSEEAHEDHDSDG